MKILGFSPQKPLKEAYEQDPKKVKNMNRILKKLRNSLEKTIKLLKRRLKKKRYKYTGLMKQA